MRIAAEDLPQFVRDALPEGGLAQVTVSVERGKVKWFVDDKEIKQRGIKLEPME